MWPHYYPKLEQAQRRTLMTTSEPVNYLGDPRSGGVSGLRYDSPQLTFAWGDRLHEYQEPIANVRRYAHAELGEFAASAFEHALQAQRNTRWELEIVLCSSSDDSSLRRMVGYAVPDQCLVDELVRAYASDASKRTTAMTDASEDGADDADTLFTLNQVDHGGDTLRMEDEIRVQLDDDLTGGRCEGPVHRYRVTKVRVVPEPEEGLDRWEVRHCLPHGLGGPVIHEDKLAAVGQRSRERVEERRQEGDPVEDRDNHAGPRHS